MLLFLFGGEGFEEYEVGLCFFCVQKTFSLRAENFLSTCRKTFFCMQRIFYLHAEILADSCWCVTAEGSQAKKFPYCLAMSQNVSTFVGKFL